MNRTYYYTGLGTLLTVVLPFILLNGHPFSGRAASQQESMSAYQQGSLGQSSVPGGLVHSLRSRGGAWIWTTRHNWTTTIWYLANEHSTPRPVEVLENKDEFGIDCTYTASPGGRWILYGWSVSMDAAPHWSLMDRIQGTRKRLPRRANPWNLEDPIWCGEDGVLFRRTYPYYGRGTRYPDEVWFLRLRDGSLHIKGRLASQDRWERIVTYHLKYDIPLKKNLRLLRHFPNRYLQQYETVLDRLLAHQYAPWLDGNFSAVVLPDGSSIAICDIDRVCVYAVPGYRLIGSLGLPWVRQARLSSLQALNNSELSFNCAQYVPGQGVGSDESGQWGPRRHPSRYRTPIFSWNFRTNHLAAMGEGEDLMRLPPLPT